jgi:uncharacterized protein (TIGR00159 family)
MGALFDFVASVRWQDIADIVINSYLLFRFYVLFRGTPVLRVLAGIVLLWFAQRLAFFLGLIVTSWALQGFTAVAALIIIIIFRNEIRSVLQTKNFRGILWGLASKGASTPVEIIVASVYELSKQHIGALMVIPGKEDLEDLVQEGIHWQGKVSREMIISIFWPDNPVHDGAAVIDGERVGQVGVILPLSQRPDLPSQYGTRHRAALGLTEASDAMVIVVSEETGRVSLAKGGRFVSIADNTELARLLLAHLGASSQDQLRLKDEKRHLAIAAAVSILLVLAVWMSFTRGQDTLITYEIPVEYIKRDPTVTIVETSTNTVKLHLSGASSLIQSMRPDKIKVRLDLGTAVVGRNSFAITQESISVPPGIRVNRVEPAEVSVVLDVPVALELPVQVDWIGRLSPGLILENAVVSPSRVRITGGSTQMANLTTIYTEKIPLDKLRQSATMTVNLVLNPPSLMVEPESHRKVTVTYTIREREP